MNKGEQLEALLDKANILHDRMNQIFLKQGLITPDLSLLSSADKENWLRLYEQSKKVSDDICNLINNINYFEHGKNKIIR